MKQSPHIRIPGEPAFPLPRPIQVGWGVAQHVCPDCKKVWGQEIWECVCDQEDGWDQPLNRLGQIILKDVSPSRSRGQPTVYERTYYFLPDRYLKFMHTPPFLEQRYTAMRWDDRLESFEPTPGHLVAMTKNNDRLLVKGLDLREVAKVSSRSPSPGA